MSNERNDSIDDAPPGLEDLTQPEPLPIEWTKMGKMEDDHEEPVVILTNDVMEISNAPEETELCIVGTAGKKITKMGEDLYNLCSPNLTHFILRSHIIHKMEGLKGFQNLTLLELYDNSVKALEDLNSGEDGKPGITLNVLDMSYNVIRDMSPVHFCPNLTELYLAQNKITEIKGLKNLTKLRKLDLGANRIRKMDEEELSSLVNLEDLWLGKNKIENIGGISKLTKLRRLDVQSNRLTVVENLISQKDTLEELYLSHNNIGNRGASQPTGLALKFEKLTTLDLSRNRIANTKPFVHFESLEDLWLSGNKISTFDDIEPISVLGTREGARLEAIYLEYNPVASEFEYRKRLASIIPSLKQIDADMIKSMPSHERKENLNITPILKDASVGNIGDIETIMKEQQNLAIERAKQQMQEKK